jgi:hypothetical protein
MALTHELLEGEIVEQYRRVIETEPVAAQKEKEKEKNPGTGDACTNTNVCTEQEGCASGNTGDCCTEDKKKKKKYGAAGWFDPPVAHHR